MADIPVNSEQYCGVPPGQLRPVKVCHRTSGRRLRAWVCRALRIGRVFEVEYTFRFRPRNVR